jgi:hypothetical protein
MFLAYAAGMGLAVGTAALAVAPSRDAVPRGLRRGAADRPGPRRAAGRRRAYVAYCGWYEVRVLRAAVVVGVLVAAPLLVAVARAGRRTRESGPEEQRLVREKEAIRERAG